MVLKLKARISEVRDEPVLSKSDQDINRLVELMKGKISTADKHEIPRLLTLAPQSWTYEQIRKELNVSRRMVWKSKDMLKTQGLLGQTPKKKGRPLSEETKTFIHNIYTDQELTRELAGERNTVSFKDEGENKTFHQKHLS